MNGHGSKNPLWRLFFIAVGLQIMGTYSFIQWDAQSFGDAFYHTLLILLTHFPHGVFTSTISKITVVFLIVSSLVLVAYLLKWFAEYMIGISDNVRRRRVKTKIDKLKDHYIVCGLGRVGSQVALELHHEGVPFVGIDRDQVNVDEAQKQGYLAIKADSTTEEALNMAGFERAKGLVASLGSDSENLLVTLAARSLNPELYIVSRANRAESEVKLKRAGANRVALPYQIGGYHMATMVVRPNVVDYLDIVNSQNGSADLEVEEMVVGDDSKLAGQHLGKALADESIKGATVIAINGVDGTSRVRPTGQEVVYPGDRLIILGRKQDLTQASALIR